MTTEINENLNVTLLTEPTTNDILVNTNPTINATLVIDPTINDTLPIESTINGTLVPRPAGILSDDTAVHLFRSVRRNSNINPGELPVLNSDHTNVSWLSLTDQSDTCRICRCKRNDSELIQCPCNCTGTMGFIHTKCLQRWIRIRNSSYCEICKVAFRIPQEQKNYYRLFKAFFQAQYFGACVKIILNLVSLTPLVYFTMNQLIITVETLNEEEPVKVLIFGPAMLLATSIYFFFYFEWALSSLLRIKNILRHWWSFGDQDDDEYYMMDNNEPERGLFDFDM